MSNNKYLQLNNLLNKAKESLDDSSNFYVGLVVINSKGQVLLGKRREDGIWTGPGGGSEGNETPTSTAVREAFEEAQLEIDAEKLIKLDTLEARNGKKVHCFLYYTDQKNTSPNLDPDEEVKKWEWYDQEDIPKDLTKDSNRHTAVMNGIMTIKGLKKAEYMKLNDLLKGHRAPLGTVSNGRKKVAEGKWVPVKQAQTTNAKVEDSPEATHHQDEAQRHMSEAAKYTELESKLKEKISYRKKVDPNYKVPEEAQNLLDEAKTKAKAHSEDYQSKNKAASKVKKSNLWELNDILKGKMQIAMQDHEPKEQYAADKRKFGTEPKPIERDEEFDKAKSKKDPKVEKSLIDAGNFTAIDTADNAIVEAASVDWLPKFQEIMDQYNYGDAPRKLELSRGYSIMMSKVDDGLYSGYVTQTKDRDGAPLEENVAKVSQQTLPDIIQYLKAREYIMPENHCEAVERVEEELEQEDESPKLVTEMPQKGDIDRKIRFLDLLNKLMNGL